MHRRSPAHRRAGGALGRRRHRRPGARASPTGIDRKTAVAEVAAALGVPKRVVYDAALALKDADRPR